MARFGGMDATSAPHAHHAEERERSHPSPGGLRRSSQPAPRRALRNQRAETNLLAGWNPETHGGDQILSRSLEKSLVVTIAKQPEGNGGLACRSWCLAVTFQGQILTTRRWQTFVGDGVWFLPEEKPGLWVRRTGESYQLLGYQEYHGLPEEFGEEEIGY